MLDENGQAGAELQREIAAILYEMIDLAKPDDLAFLEFQVPYITRRIAARIQRRSDVVLADVQGE